MDLVMKVVGENIDIAIHTMSMIIVHTSSSASLD